MIVFLDIHEHLTQHYSDVYYTVFWNLLDVFYKIRNYYSFNQVALISVFDDVFDQEVRVYKMCKYRLHHTNKSLSVSKNRACFEAFYLLYELIIVFFVFVFLEI